MDEGYFLFSIFILFNKKPLVVHTTNGFFIPLFAGSKTPTSKFNESKEVR